MPQGTVWSSQPHDFQKQPRPGFWPCNGGQGGEGDVTVSVASEASSTSPWYVGETSRLPQTPSVGSSWVNQKGDDETGDLVTVLTEGMICRETDSMGRLGPERSGKSSDCDD